MKNFFKNRLIQHIFFWLLAYLFWLFTMFVASEFKNVLTFEPLFITFIFNLCFALAVYVNLYILLPLLFKKRRFSLYVIFLLGLISITGLVIDLLLVFPLNSFVQEETFFQEVSVMVAFNFSFFTAFYVGITSFFSFIRQWFQISIRMKDVETEKLEAELKALKAQINPHFLFNSLNNIYSLTLDQSPKAPDLILRLSDMMRYILYECNDRFVLLDKEMAFVHNYLELQRVRLEETVPVRMDVIGTLNNQVIAPLLIEPLIENAFKHGLSNGHQDAFVDIIFNFEEPESLKLIIENSCGISCEQRGSDKKGIGISNVIRRLELLYPGKHQMNIELKKKRYKVTLHLELGQ